MNFASLTKPAAGRWCRWGLGFLLMVFLVAATVASPASAAEQLANQKETMLKQARGLLDQDPGEAGDLRRAIALLEGSAVQFPDEVRFPLYLAEAYYRLADPDADVNREYPYYEKTEAYAKKALEIDPNRAEGHYWHGLAWLKKAQKQGGVGAYFTVRKGIKELETVRRSLPGYDHGGASRVLGLVYCLAPAWSPFGDLNKSIQLAQESTRLAPDYPLNRLYLAEAYKKRGDKDNAIKEYQKILADAGKLTGPQAENFDRLARAGLRELGGPI